MRVLEISSNRRWVEQEFAGVSLGDRRRDARLLEAATAMADQPTASNPQRFDWNELRAFYRLVHARRSTPEVLPSGHRERTRADGGGAAPRPHHSRHDRSRLH